MKLKTAASIILITSLLSGQVYANTADMISDEQLKDARAEMQRAIEQATQAHNSYHGKDVRPHRFSFESLPQPATLVRQKSFEELWQLKVDQVHNSDELYKLVVFVSFSMPDASLQRLFSDGARMGESITFVFRGLDESKNLQSMLQRVHKLNEKYNATINIDPGLFDRFGVHSVPAMVVYRDDPTQLQTCLSQGISPDDIKDSYVGVYGDVSLDYALEHMLKLNLTESKEHGVQALLKKVKREL
jgi:type-F conjugative transfer system pilin assembly protein TrbC